MKQGKLPHDLLADLLGRLPARDPRVIVGPRVGEDAAAVRVGDRLIVVGMDPITFATDLIGWYAVQVNANDIAVMGAEPEWLLATLLLPQDATEDEAASIFDQLVEACEELGIVPIGGHTEVTSSVERPVVVGCMLGEADPERLVTTDGACAGDAVILCGAAAIEGTAILAREMGELLREKGMAADALARAGDFLFDPGISVVSAARAAAKVGVTAMHDPTEGGIATGLLELALASKVGLEIDGDQIPVLPLTREVCSRLGVDPLGLIASGALLMTVRPEGAEGMLRALQGLGREAAVIGRALPKSEGLSLLVEGKRQPLPRFSRDEVGRLFEEAGERD
ncbi:MAG: AIR synthase family protein [Armatimonadetes bacterium]|nr:AIR synthase family protein [Armatimonadota bacterium]